MATKLSRQEKASIKKEQILAAAFNEFTKNGFALTKMDDIAEKASVSKGLIYHHFSSKEALLKELVRTHIVILLPKDIPEFKQTDKVKVFLHKMFSTLIKEISKGNSGRLFSLILSEGERFPGVAEMYYTTVILPATQKFEQLLKIAWRNGELKNKNVLDYPQILAAPLLMSLIWSKLFDKYKKIDYDKLLNTHLENIFND